LTRPLGHYQCRNDPLLMHVILKWNFLHQVLQLLRCSKVKSNSKLSVSVVDLLNLILLYYFDLFVRSRITSGLTKRKIVRCHASRSHFGGRFAPLGLYLGFVYAKNSSLGLGWRMTNLLLFVTRHRGWRRDRNSTVHNTSSDDELRHVKFRLCKCLDLHDVANIEGQTAGVGVRVRRVCNRVGIDWGQAKFGLCCPRRLCRDATVSDGCMDVSIPHKYLVLVTYG